MKKLKISNLYQSNKTIEIIFFGISVLLVNLLLSEKLYWWLLFLAIVIILLEIFIKNKEYNPIIRAAVNKEEKIRKIELGGVTNHYFMRISESKNQRNSAIAKANLVLY